MSAPLHPEAGVCILALILITCDLRLRIAHQSLLLENVLSCNRYLTGCGEDQLIYLYESISYQ